MISEKELLIKSKKLMTTYEVTTPFKELMVEDRQIKFDRIHYYLMLLANQYPNKNIDLDMSELMACMQIIRDEI
ncbi:hypothetical protein [Photobacterium toruni]|uniref:Uncharacterized protein n=1 Tax=Photobacterium toruni TaxID=1935446 RepID=A0A1T4UUH9_9GAMM|nr:hypothetical protein [Photobacterium toruni]SKA56352.1 hypothetical protein CZ814_03735 [Photobacterium toruni]